VALRSIAIRRSGVRPNLLMGGDREIVMLCGLLAGALIGPAIDSPKAWIAGLLIWFAGVWAAQKMGKADPLMRFVALRHLRYQHYYPARSTPFRVNTEGQGRQYRQPGKKR